MLFLFHTFLPMKASTWKGRMFYKQTFNIIVHLNNNNINNTISIDNNDTIVIMIEP